MFNQNAPSYQCPYCGSENIVTDGEIKDVDDAGIDSIFEEVHCNACHANFYSKFTFTCHEER